MVCLDNNGTELNIGDGVMYIVDGCETEAVVVELLENNMVKIESEIELIDVKASDCFLLP